jgi:hypothetical protein
MYPTRYIDIGKIWAVEDVMLNSLLMNGIAFDGRPEPRVLFKTSITPIKTMAAFFLYE